MRLQQIIELLKDTELKQIIIGEDDPQILSLLNLALIDVYARLDILIEEQLITLEANRTMYRLQENSQRVIQVMLYREADSDYATEVPINDQNSIYSVFTPQPYVLHVPRPLDGKVISIMQSVSPPYITKDTVNTVDFIVPPQLLEPISNYIGYRAYKSMNGDKGTEQTSHHERYLQSINDVRKQGLIHPTIITNLKLSNRGFGGSKHDSP